MYSIWQLLYTSAPKMTEYQNVKGCQFFPWRELMKEDKKIRKNVVDELKNLPAEKPFQD